MERLKEFAGRYWKVALIVLVAIAGAFFWGRSSAPARVETREVVKEVIVEKIDTKILQELIQQNKEFRQSLTELKKSIHKEKWSRTLADGSSEMKEVVDINVSRVVQEQELRFIEIEKKSVEQHFIDRVVDRVVEKEKIVERKAQFKVGVLVGLNFDGISPASFATPAPQAILGQPWVLGAQFEHRLFNSPFWLGVWGNTGKQVGLSLSFEF